MRFGFRLKLVVSLQTVLWRGAAALLLTAPLFGCNRSYFGDGFVEKETCAVETMRCSGVRVQHCPYGVWQTLEDCALFDMVCSSETGRVGCVEILDTEPSDTDSISVEIEDTETTEYPPPDAGPDTDNLMDAGADGGAPKMTQIRI